MKKLSVTTKRAALICILLWLSCASGLAIAGFAYGLKTVLPGPSSVEALNRNTGEQIAKKAGIEPRDELFLTLAHPSLTISDSAFTSASESLWTTLHDLGIFLKVQTLGHSWLDENLFVSRDTHTLLYIADSRAPINQVARDLELLPKILGEWQQKYPGFRLHYISNGTADLEMFSVINRDLDRSLVYTVPVTLIILIWSFGSLVAALLPLALALVSLAASLGCSAIVSTIWYPVSATASQLVVLLVLALGVDYSLFIISRMREEVTSGLDYVTAIRIAVAKAGTAVLWSGLTVALSLFGLLLMNDTILTSMALVSILSVVITVISVFFVLPSILLLLQERVEYGKIWKSSLNARTSSYVVKLSTKYPAFAFCVGLVLIGVLSSACFYLQLGTTVEPKTLPKSMQSAQAFSELAKSFPVLAGPDLSVIMTAPDLNEKEDEGELQPFLSAVAETNSLRGPIKIDRSKDSTVVRYHFVTSGSANDQSNQDLVKKLRQEIFPEELESRGITAHLSGVLPFAVDDTIRYNSRTPLVFIAVLGLCMAFLLIAFHSVIVPLHAICLNLFSTAAAFGVLVLLFQTPGVIESFIPALLFSILFGLSMDYHVFLVSRIQEKVLSSESTRRAVEYGVSTTYRTITSAALIMVSVFAIIATLELPIMKQLGVGLAAAVLMDATIIRLILLPSSMIMLGKWNWYLPKWLAWIPKIEGH